MPLEYLVRAKHFVYTGSQTPPIVEDLDILITLTSKEIQVHRDYFIQDYLDRTW